MPTLSQPASPPTAYSPTPGGSARDLEAGGVAGPRGAAHVAAGLVASVAVVGVLDIAFAILYCQAVNRACVPSRVFQLVASGLLGPSAFRGGGAVVALGAVLHFTVAAIWSALYLAADRNLPWLRRRTADAFGTLAVGLAYGVLVWLAMQYVVLPLSGARPTPITSPGFPLMLLWHTAGVGLPIVLLLRSEPDRR